MKRLHWVMKQIVDALGLLGLAGAAMGIVAISIYFGSIQPGLREIASLKKDLTSMRSHPEINRHYAPAEELAMFYDFFPKRDALAEQLRTIHHLAADQELSVDRVDYKLTRIAGTPLWRYQITLPLNTDYGSLRHFIADVLKALPNAALEDIELEREHADAELLEEKIGLVLFFREPL